MFSVGDKLQIIVSMKKFNGSHVFMDKAVVILEHSRVNGKKGCIIDIRGNLYVVFDDEVEDIIQPHDCIAHSIYIAESAYFLGDPLPSRKTGLTAIITGMSIFAVFMYLL